MTLRKAVTYMKFKSLGYCISQGFKNIGRNRVFSLASVATMSLCIFLLGLFYSVTSNVSYMFDQMSNTLCVKVFFDAGISDARIKSIGNSIKDYNGVTIVHFTSAEEAWDKVKLDYFGEEYIDMAEGFEKDNPLANSASYEVYFEDAGMQANLVKYIESIQGVRSVNSSQITADSLTEIGSLIGVVSAVILGILIAVALFLINNTISIGITVRDEEISIMKLLGARNAFVRAPFVVEGITIGVIGAALPLLLVFVLYDSAVEYILNKFSFISTVLTFQPIGEVFQNFVPMALALGIGLGLLGSIISLSRHLKV